MTAAPIRSFRTLRDNWKVTVVAVLSLGAAMALGVVSLAVSNTFLLLPPAGNDPERLVTISERTPGNDNEEISYPDYEYFRANNHVFTDIAGAPNSISVNFQADEHGEIRVISRPVSDNYFSVLGIKPFLGRLFVAGDDRADPPVAVMTYACWKRLGSDPNIVGRQITGRTIVGVAPKEFTGSLYGLNGDLVLSLSKDETSPKREERHLILLGRLKPGVSRRQAEAEMRTLTGQLAAAYPATVKEAAAQDEQDRKTVLSRATLLPPDALPTAEAVSAVLLGLVLLVLLIACANVANLLLAMAVGRRREAAIKMALGAQRGRLIREFLMESAMLCAAGGVLGYAIAEAAAARFSNLQMTLPMWGTYAFGLNLHLDWRVAGGTAALVLIAILATGLAPALYASSPQLALMLSGEVAVGGTRKNARRNALVIVQVAVCTLVLVGMGLCERSLYNLRHVDVGFSERNLIADQLYTKNEGFDEARGKELYGEIRRAAMALPGVQAVTLASELPLLGGAQVPVQVPDSDKKVQVGRAVVDGDYFSTFGFRLLGGRTFDSRDREKSPEIIVINHKMAEMFWPGQDPVGRSMMAEEPPRKVTVVGVVGDGKYGDLDEEPRPFLYYALTQHYQESINVIARTKGDPKLWSEPLAKAMHGVGFQAPVQPATYEAWMNLTLLPQRITAAVVAALSGIGLALAIVGLAAAISYSVSERRKELGIRVALGARPWQLLRMILRQTGVVAGVGVAAGIGLGVGGTAALRSQLFGISPVEWTVLVPVGAGVLGVALAVAYVSARPWIKVDAMEAVRHV
jgi:predicted permease